MQPQGSIFHSAFLGEVQFKFNLKKLTFFSQKVRLYSRKPPKSGLFKNMGLYSRVRLHSSGYGTLWCGRKFDHEVILKSKFVTTYRKLRKNIYCNILQFAIEYPQIYCILQYAINGILLRCIFIEIALWFIAKGLIELDLTHHSFLVLQDKIQDMTNARNGSRSNQIYMIVHGGSNDYLPH